MTTMANARISPEIREMLLGHSIGLSNSYYRPTVEEMLNEYLKVVNDLIIDPSHRLSKQVHQLKEKEDYQTYIIDKKMVEKDEQIQVVTSKLDEYVEVQKEGRIMSKEIVQRFTDLEKKFNDLMGVNKKERKYNRVRIRI